VEEYDYTVFGEPNTISDVNNPYMFTGRRYDSETSLYYYRARMYAPDIGRFLQPDPIPGQYVFTVNTYMYVSNNPVNFVDPSGRGWFKCIVKIIKAYRACSDADMDKVHKKAKKLENKWYRKCLNGSECPSECYPSHARAKALGSKEFKEFLKELGKCGKALASGGAACGSWWWLI
jgi:RHS repeat-associated protein